MLPRHALSRTMSTAQEAVIAIIGTTGVGKSQLGVELAKALNTEVINADSMQVYKGIDILTNKITEQERESVPHHLMDILEPHQEYKVTDFHADASKIISSLNTRNCIPILVGGTHYYIQSLLWKDTLISPSHPTAKDIKVEDNESQTSESVGKLDADTATLYARLEQVDPVMAKRWHPLDRRKIRRSLEVFMSTGKRHSDLILEQKSTFSSSSKLRYRTCIFWLFADPTVLSTRLDTRIDNMIKIGLFDEIKSLRQKVREGKVRMPEPGKDMYQRGIWQAIGYKEFEPYFAAQESAQSTNIELSALLNECTELMKIATRQYAKRQVRWIQHTLLPKVWRSQDMADNTTDDQEENIVLYLLDATSLERWNENVKDIAIRLSRDFFAGKNMPDPKTINSVSALLLKNSITQDPVSRIFNWQKYTCSICSNNSAHPLIINGEQEWNQHIKSRRHRKAITKKDNIQRSISTNNENL